MGLKNALLGFRKGWSSSEIGGGGYFGAVANAQYGYDGAYGHFYQIQNDYFERLLDTGIEYNNKGYVHFSKLALSNPFGQSCMRVISESIAGIKMECVKEMPGGKREVSDDHPMLDLLYANGRTPLAFIEPMLHHLHFAGEVFLYRPMSFTSSQYRPFELGYICPSTFQSFIRKGINEPDGFMNTISRETYENAKFGTVVGYKFMPGQVTDNLFTGVFGGMEGHFKSIDNCVHFYRYNPWVPMRGLALIEGAHLSLQQAYLTKKWNINIAKFGGRIPAYFVPEGLRPGDSLTPEQRDRVEEDLDKNVRERTEQGKPLVLSGTMKYIEANMTPRDADFLDSDKYTGRQICNVFRVPAVLANDPDSVGLGGGSGAKQANKNFYESTLLPLYNSILDELNYKVMAPFDDGFKLCYNRNTIEALQEDEEKRDKRLVLSSGGAYKTVNEARVEGGKEPMPDSKYDEIREPKSSMNSKYDDDQDQRGRESNNNNNR